MGISVMLHPGEPAMAARLKKAFAKSVD